jgi:hypothetical protein
VELEDLVSNELDNWIAEHVEKPKSDILDHLYDITSLVTNWGITHESPLKTDKKLLSERISHKRVISDSFSKKKAASTLPPMKFGKSRAILRSPITTNNFSADPLNKKEVFKPTYKSWDPPVYLKIDTTVVKSKITSQGSRESLAQRPPWRSPGISESSPARTLRPSPAKVLALAKSKTLSQQLVSRASNVRPKPMPKTTPITVTRKPSKTQSPLDTFGLDQVSEKEESPMPPLANAIKPRVSFKRILTESPKDSSRRVSQLSLESPEGSPSVKPIIVRRRQNRPVTQIQRRPCRRSADFANSVDWFAGQSAAPAVEEIVLPVQVSPVTGHTRTSSSEFDEDISDIYNCMNDEEGEIGYIGLDGEEEDLENKDTAPSESGTVVRTSIDKTSEITSLAHSCPDKDSETGSVVRSLIEKERHALDAGKLLRIILIPEIFQQLYSNNNPCI